jgi:hypothetical protein
MNGNPRMGVEDEGAGQLMNPWVAPVLGETVYVGRASFRMALEADLATTPQAADASTWFTQPPALPRATTRARRLDREPRERPLPIDGDVAPIVIEGRAWSWVKPSWIVVAIPVIAFTLGFLVAPLAGSSLGHGAAKSRGAAPASHAQAEVQPASVAPIIARAEPLVAPILAATPPGPTTRPEAPIAPRVSPVAKSVTRQGRPMKAHASRKSSVANRASSRDDSTDALDDAGTEAKTEPAAKRWIDPWAN